ncbi:DNA topoisomerase [Scenedesmus sp. NREL 46B-D3]|nr:DNA topoisomerase [Scenedesmus sp. NREL 46B-D3]
MQLTITWQQPKSIQGGKAIEEIYQKKSQLEHILLRPDTYIGSTEKQQQTLWVHDGERLVYKAITYAPGLFKIFDEILVNAADNKVRDASMDTIRVDISPETNTIKVWNNGDGIPVEMHKEEGVYVPELIFGHLLTSSNYNDMEKKITGGRNGYGAKLANIFSTKFSVETCDGKRQRRFLQTFTANMSTKSAPKITACKATDNWTCITFQPDLAKFDMQELEADVVALMAKRVYDVAGVLNKGCKVYLNGTRLPIKTFADYCDLYLGPKENGVPRIHERVNDRWEVVISATDGQFQQVSFANSICTSKGGTHVNYVVDQITKHLVEKLNKKSKANNTKETLTIKASSFGSKCELTTQLMDKVAKCGVMDNILSFAAFKNQKELKKSDGAKRSRLVGVTKLTDANDAGTRNSHMCTLILTEGDSAKTLAMSGLSVVGHDHWGVFPLRGKLLNVRDATALQISENQEIQHIKQILGLQHGKNYEDVKALRYGHLMIMTDQDHDGSHIKGLIMNFMHTFYPSLLKVPGFLVEFITPIIKVRKGNRTQCFYTMPEYDAWRESLANTRDANGWDIKYYKGLGTSTAKEAKEYFANMDLHKKDFVWEDEDDGQSIEMAFSKKKVEDRKRWLSAFKPGTYLDQSVDTISYKDFVHKELILFSRADLERSIPSVVDGLKPGQRKILYCCFKRNLKKDIKVAQLAGYVSEHSAYHHGEASLQGTIVGLAQDFVGSNNLNLLYPSGQFGTRLQGGKDAASARYIYTRLAGLTRHVFNKADDKLLSYLNEEGQSIEPEWYMPILPMVLVNGAEGIGTGWSTFIPNYSPREIAANLKRLLQGQPLEPMQPWYKGFRGSIAEVATKNQSGKSYSISGTIAATGDSSVTITELPVRSWTQPYKEFLEGLLKGAAAPTTAAGRKKAADGEAGGPASGEGPLLADYKEHHTDVSVHFDVDLVPGKLAALQAGPGGLETKFKLNSKISTGNMMLFDAEGHIKRYDSPEDILREFFDLRLQFYERRRVGLLQDAQWELMRASNKIRFILAVISGELVLANRKRADIEGNLEAQGFDKMAKSKDVSVCWQQAAAATGGRTGARACVAQDDSEEEIGRAAAAAAAVKESYDYLLSMAIYSLTWEKVQSLTEEADAAAAEVARLETADICSMWAEDLDAFLERCNRQHKTCWAPSKLVLVVRVQAYDLWEAEEAAAANQLVRQQQKAKARGKAAAKGAKGGKGKKAATPWSDDDDDVEMMDSEDEFVAPKPKKPAAPRAPRAPKPAAQPAAAPAPAAAAVPSSTATGSMGQPQYKVPTAAPPKHGSKAGKAAAAARQPAAAAPPAAAPAAAPAAPAESEPMSLADRLKKMAIKPSASRGSSGDKAAPAAAAARPGRQAARAAAASYSFAGSDEDEGAASSDGDCSSDPDEAMSPAPELLKAKAKPRTGAAAAGRSKAAVLPSKPVSPSPRVAFGRSMSSSESPLVEKKAAPKRKPRGLAHFAAHHWHCTIPQALLILLLCCILPALFAALPAEQKARKVAGSPLPVPAALLAASRAPAAAAAAAAGGAKGKAAAAAKPKAAAAAAGRKKAAAAVVIDSSDGEEDAEMPAAAAEVGQQALLLTALLLGGASAHGVHLPRRTWRCLMTRTVLVAAMTTPT